MGTTPLSSRLHYLTFATLRIVVDCNWYPAVAVDRADFAPEALCEMASVELQTIQRIQVSIDFSEFLFRHGFYLVAFQNGGDLLGQPVVQLPLWLRA